MGPQASAPPPIDPPTHPDTTHHSCPNAQVELLPGTGEVCFTVLAVAPTVESSCNGAAVLKKLEVKTRERGSGGWGDGLLAAHCTGRGVA